MKVKKRNLVLIIGLILVICFFYIGIKSTRTSASLSDVYIESTYSLNEEFTAPEAKIIIEDTEYIASALLKYPSGNVRNATRTVLNESGKYTLEYKLLKNNKLYSKEYSFMVYDEVYSTTGKGSSFYGKHDYLGDVEGRVVTLPKGSVFKYNKVLNVSDLTRNDVLIKFYILPATIGIADVNRITVRLTDIYDENNYVNIVSKDGEPSSLLNVANAAGQTETGCETCSEDYSGTHPVIVYKGQTYKKFPGNLYGTGNWGSVHLNGKPSLGSISTNYLTIEFDYEEKSLYNRAFLICDLDDPAFFSKPWKGFTTGEVFLTIEASGYSSESVTLMVTDIYGADLKNNVSKDDKPPVISIDTSGFDGAIEGVLNEKFKIFSASASDINDGETVVEKRVFYDYLNRKISVPVVHDQFIPETPGIYTIEYSTQDRAGNKAVKAINVIVTDKSEGLDICFNGSFDDSGIAGKIVTVKDFSLINAHGKTKCKIYAENYENNIRYDIDNGEFLPIYTGKYKIVYEFSDYIYNKTASYDVIINASDKPYLNAEMVYTNDYYVKNKEYSFVEAEGYSFNAGKTIKEKTYVAVYNDENSEYEKIYEPEESFYVHAEKSIKLRYFTVNSEIIKDINKIDFSNTDFVDYRDFSAIVKDLGYKEISSGDEILDLSQMFDADGFTVESTSDGISFSKNALSQNKNAYVKFINGIYFSGFLLNLSFKDNSTKAFSVRFLDFATKQILYKVNYKVTANTVFTTINNGEVEYFASNTENRIFLKFDIGSMTFTPCNGISVDLDKTFDGKDFIDNFDRKLCFDIEFNDIAEAGDFLITEIANQKLTDDAIDDVPPIVFGIDISGRYSIKKEYIIKPAYSYDVISPSVKFTLMAVGPDGEIVKDVNGNLLKNADPTMERKILLEQYGEYYFYFLATDEGLANPVRATRIISVIDDEAPVIELKDKKTNYKKGDKVEIADYTVTDNTSNTIKTYVYVMHELNVATVENGEFIASKTGKYTINYLCSDEYGNWSFVSYEISVE